MTSPGNQTGTVGTAASVQITAADSAAGQTLSYAATGLPAGPVDQLLDRADLRHADRGGHVHRHRHRTDGTGAAGSATFSWTVSSSGGEVAARLPGGVHDASQWAGGFVASMTISNTGSVAINGWTLGVHASPATRRSPPLERRGHPERGERVDRNASYNGASPAGSSTRSASRAPGPAATPRPPRFTLNGATCTT